MPDLDAVRAIDVLGKDAWRRLGRQRGWRPFVAALEAPPGDEPSLAEAATLVGESSRQLTRVFKALTGMTYGDFLMERGMAEARRLIDAHPRWPLREVARRIKYASAQSLERAYTEFWLETPSGKRMKHKPRSLKRRPSGT